MKKILFGVILGVCLTLYFQYAKERYHGGMCTVEDNLLKDVNGNLWGVEDELNPKKSYIVLWDTHNTKGIEDDEVVMLHEGL